MISQHPTWTDEQQKAYIAGYFDSMLDSQLRDYQLKKDEYDYNVREQRRKSATKN